MHKLMLHTLLLSQVLGVYLIIMAAAMVNRVKFFRKIVSHLDAHNPSLFFFMPISLLAGLFLINIHGGWDYHPGVIITIIGWYILIRSVLFLISPEKVVECYQAFYAGVGYYYAVAICAVLGLILLTDKWTIVSTMPLFH